MRIGFQVESIETTLEAATALQDAFKAHDGCVRAGVTVDADRKTFKAFGIFDGELDPIPDGCRKICLVGADEKRAEAFSLYGGTIKLVPFDSIKTI